MSDRDTPDCDQCSDTGQLPVIDGASFCECPKGTEAKADYLDWKADKFTEYQDQQP